MSYMNDFETELRTRLESNGSAHELVRWVCEQVLKSYRNGIKAGEKGERVIRNGESRRRGSSGKAE